MEIIFGKFMLTYLLMPLIAVVLGVLMMFIAKKNKLLNNKKFILYFLLTCVILAIPALAGFIDYWFMPYAYILLQILYLFLGYWNMKIQRKVIRDFSKKPYYLEFLLTFSCMLIGAFFFSTLFNVVNELQYGIWASTCLITFIFPTLFHKAWQTYLDIPLEVYKLWKYDYEKGDINLAEYSEQEILVVELELFRQSSDLRAFNIKAKAPCSMLFGDWFQLFLADYNKRSPETPIHIAEDEWIFYTYTSVLKRRRYIDPDLSFIENKVKEEHTILAKRVLQTGNEEDF